MMEQKRLVSVDKNINACFLKKVALAKTMEDMEQKTQKNICDDQQIPPVFSSSNDCNKN